MTLYNSCIHLIINYLKKLWNAKKTETSIHLSICIYVCVKEKKSKALILYLIVKKKKNSKNDRAIIKTDILCTIT